MITHHSDRASKPKWKMILKNIDQSIKDGKRKHFRAEEFSVSRKSKTPGNKARIHCGLIWCSRFHQTQRQGKSNANAQWECRHAEARSADLSWMRVFIQPLLLGPVVQTRPGRFCTDLPHSHTWLTLCKTAQWRPWLFYTVYKDCTVVCWALVPSNQSTTQCLWPCQPRGLGHRPDTNLQKHVGDSWWSGEKWPWLTSLSSHRSTSRIWALCVLSSMRQLTMKRTRYQICLANLINQSGYATDVQLGKHTKVSETTARTGDTQMQFHSCRLMHYHNLSFQSSWLLYIVYYTTLSTQLWISMEEAPVHQI